MRARKPRDETKHVHTTRNLTRVHHARTGVLLNLTRNIMTVSLKYSLPIGYPTAENPQWPAHHPSLVCGESTLNWYNWFTNKYLRDTYYHLVIGGPTRTSRFSAFVSGLLSVIVLCIYDFNSEQHWALRAMVPINILT